MKNQIKSTLAAILMLGSLNAQAMTDAQIDFMNTEGKIEAAMASQRCSECDNLDITEGKIAAATMMNMRIMIEESQNKIEEIRRIGDIVGQSMEDSQGLLKFIGEKETFAEMAINEMKALEKKADFLSGDALFAAHSRIAKLAGEIQDMNQETQITFDKLVSRRK